MADVRGQRVDLSCRRRRGRARSTRRPSTQKSRLKRRLRSAASLLEPVGVRGILPDVAGQPGAAQLGVVGVALQLAGGPRKPGQAAVAVGDRVPGVLPALVLEAGLLVAALVGDVAVALQVGVVVDPGQGRPRLALERAHQLRVARPALVLVEEHDVERSGVGRAVVGRVRPLLEGGHLAVAHLVQDAPGVLVAEVVETRALPDAERHQRARGELGGEGQRLQAGEDAVAAEHRHEPGQAGGRQAVPRQNGRREAQRGQVDQAAMVGRLSGSQSHSRRGACSSQLSRLVFHVGPGLLGVAPVLGTIGAGAGQPQPRSDAAGRSSTHRAARCERRSSGLARRARRAPSRRSRSRDRRSHAGSPGRGDRRRRGGSTRPSSSGRP